MFNRPRTVLAILIGAASIVAFLPFSAMMAAAPMVLTVLEARVDPERAKSLETLYRDLAAQPKPNGFVQSHLVRSPSDSAVWRIQTMWRDRQALEAMRGQGTPAGVLLFRQVGAEPQLSIFDVVVDMNAVSR